mgnify:FL=1
MLYITKRYYIRMVLMPAVRKVSKEQIIDAVVEVLRDDGFSAINARSVAKKLGCSTQPIYFSFKNMDELKAALIAIYGKPAKLPEFAVKAGVAL